MRLYEQAVLLAGADIPVGTLQNWLQRGTIALDSPETGSERRGRRRYSERDVIRLALMAELVARGFSPAAAGQIVNDETLRPLGFLPEWMSRIKEDHFLLLGVLEGGVPLITKDGKSVIKSSSELLEVISGTGRKEWQAQYSLRSAVIINLSDITRTVRERILDALATDHVADEPGETTSGAPDAPVDE